MQKNAFTLIELLVVIAIIGILATIALVSFRSSQARSRDVARKSDLRQISSALEFYYSDYGKYPAQGSIVWGTEFTDGKTVYFKVLPKDPSGGLTYYYRLVTNSNSQKFQLYAHLENSQDINCLPGASGKPDCLSPANVPGDASCGADVCNFAVTSPNTTPTETAQQ